MQRDVLFSTEEVRALHLVLQNGQKKLTQLNELVKATAEKLGANHPETLQLVKQRGESRRSHQSSLQSYIGIRGPQVMEGIRAGRYRVYLNQQRAASPVVPELAAAIA